MERDVDGRIKPSSSPCPAEPAVEVAAKKGRKKGKKKGEKKRKRRRKRQGQQQADDGQGDAKSEDAQFECAKAKRCIMHKASPQMGKEQTQKVHTEKSPLYDGGAPQGGTTDLTLLESTLPTLPAPSALPVRTDSTTPQPMPVLNPSPAPSQAFTDLAVPPSQSGETALVQQGQQPPPRLIKFDNYQFKCQLPDCRRVTDPNDGESVICPHCGPYSHVRYCSTQHLCKDTRMHWALECRKFTLQKPADASTIHPRQIAIPLAIPALYPGSMERHRQSVYHASNIVADYFIFTDGDMWREHGYPDAQLWDLHRCKGSLKLAVVFDDDQSGDSKKDRFNRLLNILLLTGPAHPDLCFYAFAMIRENVIGRGLWTEDIYSCLVYQFEMEFRRQLPHGLYTDRRHACQQEWSGEASEDCPDALCNQTVLDPQTGKCVPEPVGIKWTVEGLERFYWILRVARVYHPTVKEKLRRMKGQGFRNVPQRDRRVFSMGPEWEGHGKAPMEVEGCIWIYSTAGVPPYLFSIAAPSGRL